MNDTQEVNWFYIYKGLDMTIPLQHAIFAVNPDKPQQKKLVCMCNTKEFAEDILAMLNGSPDDISTLVDL